MSRVTLGWGALAVAVIIVLQSAFAGVGYAAPSALPTALTLQIVPSRLPADGNTYGAVVVALVDPSTRPSVTTSNLTVYFTSSLPNVAKVVSSATIAAGSEYAVANLTTTLVPGTTVITAAAAGYTTAYATITTVTPSGFPSRLKLFLVPGTVIARPGISGTVIVELLDQGGSPVTSNVPLQVSMVSTNSKVANVTQHLITLPAGQLEVTGTYTATFLTGTSTITASSPGLTQSSQTLNVVGQTATRILLFATPSKMPTLATGRVTVELTDSTGNPARAASDTVVYLRSSDNSTVTVPLSITVPAGSISASTTFRTLNHTSTTQITASSVNLVSSNVNVRTFAPSKPFKLFVELAPTVVLADDTTYVTGVVSIQDSSGVPAVFNATTTHAATQVVLTSSNAAVGTVPLSVTIPIGANYAVFGFTTTFSSGSTAITASASNLVSAQATQTSFGPAPVKIAMSLLSNSRTLPAGGGSYHVLQVAVTDSSGGPAVSPTDLVVSVISSATSVASPNATITIPAGAVAAVGDIATTSLTGSANLSAFAQGYTSTSIIVQTQFSVPAQLGLTVSPSQSIYTAISKQPFVSVQLQDSSGNPTMARADTTVEVLSSNNATIGTPLYFVIPKGHEHITATLNVKSNGTTTLTAIGSGLHSATANLAVTGLTLVTTLISNLPTLYSNQTDTISVSVKMEGQPLKGVSVSWSSTGGTMSSSATQTDKFGASSSTFTPSTEGPAVISVSLRSAAFPVRKLTLPITVNAIPVKPAEPFFQKYFLYIVAIIAIAVVAVALVAFRLIRTRRQKAREELEAGFQTLT